MNKISIVAMAMAAISEGIDLSSDITDDDYFSSTDYRK
jgi:hypothetical protein